MSTRKIPKFTFSLRLRSALVSCWETLRGHNPQNLGNFRRGITRWCPILGPTPELGLLTLGHFHPSFSFHAHSLLLLHFLSPGDDFLDCTRPPDLGFARIRGSRILAQFCKNAKGGRCRLAKISKFTFSLRLRSASVSCRETLKGTSPRNLDHFRREITRWRPF